MIIIMITMTIVIMMIMIRWESFYQVSTFASDKSQSNRSLPSPFITFILSSPFHVVIIHVAMMMLVTVLMMVTMIKDCFKREQVSYVGVCGQMHGCVLWKVTNTFTFLVINFLFLDFSKFPKMRISVLWKVLTFTFITIFTGGLVYGSWFYSEMYLL